MFTKTIASALMLASLATAHFSIEYPEMRGNSFAASGSQYVFPCMNQSSSTLEFYRSNFLRCECQPDRSDESHLVASHGRISFARFAPSMDLSFCQPGPRNCLPYVQHHISQPTSERDREWHTVHAASRSTIEFYSFGWTERQHSGCHRWGFWKRTLQCK
jgi:hypothetical protein